jgi:TPR repeat protein
MRLFLPLMFFIYWAVGSLIHIDSAQAASVDRGLCADFSEDHISEPEFFRVWLVSKDEGVIKCLRSVSAEDNETGYRFSQLLSFRELNFNHDKNKSACSLALRGLRGKYVNSNTFYTLGHCYSIFGLSGFPYDMKIANRYFLMGAEADHPKSLFEYAWNGITGNNFFDDSNSGLSGSERNRLMTYWIRAADLGDVQAQYNLGVFYHNATEPLNHFELAIGYYEKAARQGSGDAMWNMGDMLFRGRGRPKDQNLGIALVLLSKNFKLIEDPYTAEITRKFMSAKSKNLTHERLEIIQAEWLETNLDHAAEKVDINAFNLNQWGLGEARRSAPRASPIHNSSR